jgi:alkaline phosphatase D
MEYGEVREYEPPHEIVTLADYRMRYAQYRRDPDLAAVHRQFPFITVWDDHETADNSWSTGAKNHSPSEGDYAARKAVAARVYSEWMPIRDQASGKIYRSLAFGDLVDLIMLDTRIVGRDEEAENKADALDATKQRQLLGQEQEAFLTEKLSGSTAKWQILGQQVVMATFSTFVNTDAWDGYPVARERFYALLDANPTKDVVVLTGDVHMSFAFDLVRDPKSASYDPTTGAGSLAVEVVVPGVTSPGFPEQLANAAQGMVTDNRNLKWANVHQKGYAVLDITPERVQSAWYHYTPVEEKVATPTFTVAYAVAKGKKSWTLEAGEAPATTAAPAA